MKTLLLLRHAKSSWDDEAVSDYDRPLNDRGRRDAPQVGRRLAEAGLLPDRIACSSARRTRETADLLIEAAGYTGPIEHRRELYHADPADILAVVAATPADADRVLVIGHNPGLEELLYRLTGAGEHMPTSALAHIELPIETWAAAGTAEGRLVEFWRPKDDAG